MMKRTLLIASVLFCCISSSAFATIYCGGKVTNSYVTASGDLVVRGAWRNDYTRLCNLKGAVGNVSALVCSMWASYAATALTDNKQVLLSYTGNQYTCNSLPTYNGAPTPGYFMLTETPVS